MKKIVKFLRGEAWGGEGQVALHGRGARRVPELPGGQEGSGACARRRRVLLRQGRGRDGARAGPAARRHVQGAGGRPVRPIRRSRGGVAHQDVPRGFAGRAQRTAA